MNGTEITYYDNAKHAVSLYESVDELKDFRDKALACQYYAKQANDYELESLAAKARVRSERRCGDLLKDMEKQAGARGNGSNQHQEVESNGSIPPTLKEMGLNPDQSSKWQQLANVPEDEFEAALNTEGSIPSAHGILRSREPEKETEQIDRDCLFLWGHLLDFEKKLFGRNINELFDGMTPAMRKDCERILPSLSQWIER